MNGINALIVLGILTAAPAARAGDLPLDGLQINPSYTFDTAEIKTNKDSGFVYTASNARFDVEIKATPMKSEAAAKQMAQVELNSLKNLYSMRGNAYAGQISDVIQCEKIYLPKVAKLTGALNADTLTGGANERKQFGACNHDQIRYWAEYFNFYDQKGARSVAVRIFLKNPNVKSPPTRELNSFTEKLFVKL